VGEDRRRQRKSKVKSRGTPAPQRRKKGPSDIRCVVTETENEEKTRGLGQLPLDWWPLNISTPTVRRGNGETRKSENWGEKGDFECSSEGRKNRKDTKKGKRQSDGTKEGLKKTWGRNFRAKEDGLPGKDLNLGLDKKKKETHPKNSAREEKKQTRFSSKWIL